MSWVKRISNEQILEMVGMERSLVMTIRKRQLRFVGYLERKGGLEKLVLEGKIKGKRQRGRKRLDFMEGLALAAGCSAVTVLQQTGDRVGFKNMVANVRPFGKVPKEEEINDIILTGITDSLEETSYRLQVL